MGILSGSDSTIERLIITAHKKIDCSDSASAKTTFQVQVNPEKLEYEFAVQTVGSEGGKGSSGLNTTGASAPVSGFKGYNKMIMRFDFHADATGILPIDKKIREQFLIKDSGDDNAEKNTPSIRPHLDLLQNVVYGYEAELHSPPYLKLVWGNIFPDSSTDNKEKKSAVFKGMLKSCRVELLLFSLKGEPVKAKITLEIESAMDPDARPLGNSPDITHNIAINYGDRMTTHCNEIYGRFDAKICSAVAQYNNMIDWDLQPMVGKKLIFPSIHLLNEMYIEDWEQLEAKEKEQTAGNVETHYDYMVDLIGEKKAKQYFKTFDHDPNQPYEEWLQAKNKTKGFA